MRSEERVGRPFKIDQRIQISLSDTKIVYSDGTQFEASKGGLIPPPKRFAAGDKIRLEINIDQPGLLAGIAEQGLDPHDVAIFIIANVDRLRRAFEIFRVKVSELSNGIIDFDLGSAPKWVTEAILSAKVSFNTYLCLTKNVAAPDLHPTLQSTWLSRAKLRIGVADENYKFEIQPLTDEEYKLGVPRGAYSFVEIKGNVAETEAGKLEVTVYLDAEVFGAIKQYETGLPSMNAQAKLESVVLSSLLRRTIDDCKKLDVGPEDWDALTSQDPVPVVVKIVKSFAKVAKLEAPEFFRLLFDDTEIALSHVGKVLKLVDQDLKQLKPVTGDQL